MEGATNTMAVRSCESEPGFVEDGARRPGAPLPVIERVLGIDPGLTVTGYSVVEPAPGGPCVLEAGVIRPSAHYAAMGQRLAYLYRGIEEVLDEFLPSAVAVERVHSHVKYPRTAILMAHARGVIVL